MSATLIYSSKEYSRDNVLSLSMDRKHHYAAVKLFDSICSQFAAKRNVKIQGNKHIVQVKGKDTVVRIKN